MTTLPFTIALDTAGEMCSAALAPKDSDWVALRHDRVGHRHGERLLEQLDRLLAQASAKKKDIELVVFGAGPGGFTGLRVACGMAQGLAWSLACPIVGVSNLEALAWHAMKKFSLPVGTRIATMNDARMNECYAAAFQVAEDRSLVRIAQEQLVKPDDMATWMQRHQVDGWTGSAYQVYRAARPQDRIYWDAEMTAVDLVELGRKAYALGQTMTPQQVAPLYVRNRVALTAAERQRGEHL